MLKKHYCRYLEKLWCGVSIVCGGRIGEVEKFCKERTKKQNREKFAYQMFYNIGEEKFSFEIGGTKQKYQEAKGDLKEI